MRVSIEDDLRSSGRLGKLARVMGWREPHALGALVMVYRATQDLEIVEETPDKIVNAIVVDFDSDDEAHAFVSAMVSARLATLTDRGTIVIHGNDKHVATLKKIRAGASKGGSARASKKPNDSLSQAKPEASPSLAIAKSLTLTLTPTLTEDNTNTNTTLRPAKSPRAPKPKEPPTEIAQIRRTFRDGYAARYGHEYHWGAKHSGQAKHLLQNWPLAVVLDLIPKFFFWQRPDIIKGGHSWGNGVTSFVFRIDELYADTHSPERRDIAAAIHEGERDIGVSAYNRMASAEVLRGLLNPNEPKAIEATHDESGN